MQKSRRTTRQCVNGFSLFDARYVTIERHHISDEQRRKFYFRTASPIIGIATARRARRFAIVFTFFFFFGPRFRKVNVYVPKIIKRRSFARFGTPRGSTRGRAQTVRTSPTCLPNNLTTKGQFVSFFFWFTRRMSKFRITKLHCEH